MTDFPALLQQQQKDPECICLISFTYHFVRWDILGGFTLTHKITKASLRGKINLYFEHLYFEYGELQYLLALSTNQGKDIVVF